MTKGLVRLAMCFGWAMVVGFVLLFSGRYFVNQEYNPFTTILSCVCIGVVLCAAAGWITARIEGLWSPCSARAACFSLGMMPPAVTGLFWGGSSYIIHAFVPVFLAGVIMYGAQGICVEQKKKKSTIEMARSLSGFLRTS